MRGVICVTSFGASRSTPSTQEAAREVPDAEIRKVLNAGYGILSGKNVEWAELEFPAAQARWVSKEIWHPDQQGEFQPDDTYRLRVPFSEPRA
jgi:hypothetical protein